MNFDKLQTIYIQLQRQVENAEKAHLPIKSLVLQQIKLLEQTHDSFVKSALSKNKDLINDIGFSGVIIKQLQAICSLCKKIGLSTEKYDKQIRDIRIRNLGEDFVNKNYPQ